MSSIYHGQLTVSIFGQSHAPAIGVTVDGLPAGEAVDLEELQRFLQRRFFCFRIDRGSQSCFYCSFCL